MRLPTKTSRFGYVHGQRNHEGIPHPGYDLNNGPTPTSDLGQPVYAPEDGVVVYARTGSGTWGGLVVVLGKSGFAHRLGHVRNIRVKEGQEVKEGQQVAEIGEFVKGLPHLHYDMVEPKVIHTISILIKAPYVRWDFWHVNFPKLFEHMYVDPARFHPELAKLLGGK
ncbi:peptidoglycan hydrolase [Thermus phage TSP4]|nr:peptidoglycan hydrolase [Thermus phage TSP4]